ncbi:hypothetical protein [Oscillatoria salina]|uniref:hypothetical protein n=1 Tax=Oscillatoria salina TaxID=331517 RepID=UPI0013B755CF|nr:hypothetical protein [Oscillatoria salina]MBZ8182834.1 hypothetical protein [Oscillatoria salina IIICB1]NET89946.1 hypothetical protein [Kamptonema sp. SIO1D9]
MSFLAITESSHNLFFPILTFLAVAGLALVHLFAGKLRFLEVIPRSRWLSVAGGASVAYIFVHVLPELSEGQKTFEEVPLLALDFLEHHVYLVSLLGLVIFYGLEKLAHSSRKQNQATGEGDTTDPGIFWVHIGSFTLYNGLIGYLLVHREEQGSWSLLIFSLAMALHFLVNDYGLREHHKSQYKHIGRWLLAGGVVLGWTIGSVTKISEAAIAVLFAFVAGGVVLNAIKEELPEERQSNFWAFFLGAIVYTILLLAE